MVKNSTSVLKTVLIGVPAVLLAAFVAMFFVWPRVIEKRVHAFCDSVDVGMTQDAATKRAGTTGLKVKVFPPGIVTRNDPHATIWYWDGIGFDRYHCTLQSLDGKITSKKFVRVD